MCECVIYLNKIACSQGELAKLLGAGDWKRGKKLIVMCDADEKDFSFNFCLCGVDHEKTALNINCSATSDGVDQEYIPKDRNE